MAAEFTMFWLFTKQKFLCICLHWTSAFKACVTMRREIIELEAGAVDGKSIRSGTVHAQSIQPRPITPSTGDLHLKTKQCTQQWQRERQLELAGASSLSVISRLASAPLPWVQWLIGKSIRLVIRKSRVRFPAGSMWIFLSLSPKLPSSCSCLHRTFTLKCIGYIPWQSL